MNHLVDGSLSGLLLRVILVYFYVLAAMRLMGKREIGKLSVFDLVISVMIAEVSAVALERLDTPMIRGLFIILGLVLLQIGTSYLSLKSNWVRQLLEGRATALIVNGRINEQEMRKTRYSLSDLMTQLREKDIFSIADVEFAILETTGKLSVLPKADKRPLTPEEMDLAVPRSALPIPLIAEGKPLERSLKRLDKSHDWLKRQIQDEGYTDFNQIFYCCLDGSGKLYIDPFNHEEDDVNQEISRDL